MRRKQTGLVLVVSLLLFLITPVMARSSSTTNPGGTAAPQAIRLASHKQVSTTKTKHTGSELCRSVSCKRRQWRKHHPGPHFYHALHFLGLHSTAYCESGLTYSEEPTKDGVVAIVKGLPLGRYYQVRTGPLKGKVLHGSDYIGYGSEFDIWMESCDAAKAYGSLHIRVAEISPVIGEAALAHPHT